MGVSDEKIKKNFSSRMAILRDACQKALNHHNAHRAKHVDTPPMKLDDKLCEDAQKYAEKMAQTGVFDHPKEELKRLKQGENLFMSWSSGNSENDPVQKAAQASDGWYAEIANYDWKTGGKNGNMGIGVAFKGNSCYVVARYQPQGNYIGQNLTYVKPLKDAPKIPEPPKPAPTEPVKPVEPVKETLIKPPALKKDTLLKILPNLYKRFDIKLAFFLSEHKPTNQSWPNLIHFTCGSDCSKIGDRIPAIWFHPGQDKLHIRHCIDDNRNGGFDGSSPLKLGLTKIHLSQKPDANGKWCFSAVVDNNGQKKMYKCCQGTPRDFKHVKVYASDPWYDPADNAHLLSLEVETEPEPAKPAVEEKPVKKTWTTAMTHTAKYTTYGGTYSGHYKASRMLKNDSNFWHSGTRRGDRGVKVTFEKPVTITSFRVRARNNCHWRYRRVGLHVNNNSVSSAVTPSDYNAARDQFFDMMKFKKSDASFSGCEFDLRWNKHDSCRADQWAQVAFIEIDYFECKDCKPCAPAVARSLSDNCVDEFSVHSGWIVDAISVNGKKHGPDGGGEKKIKLAPGEKIIKVKYGLRGYSGKMCLCQLEFFTNKNNKYGPYGSASSCCGCYEVNNVPCDWSEAIKMDRFPVGFAGASPCSQSDDCVKEFSVHSGWIVDAISVNGKKYGPYGSASPFSPHGSRRYYEVKNLPCDWSKAIKMDKFPVGFAGASGCSQPRGG